MADAGNVYVSVTVNAKGDFASDAKKTIEQIFKNCIDGASGLSTDTPKDKKSPQWVMTVNFSGAPDKDGKNFTGKLDASASALTGSAGLIKLSNSATGTINKVGKLAARDVTEVASSVAEAMAKKAIDPLKKLKA